ncbi:acyltransferase family protein [Streptomyces hilarionis]|uniref:acyltransferase family protein n=1 Tax=Streptomyces hilarionis TaxID=2839954 RepID=UPI00211A420F|nr:acyltransferase [Streptomyces hilarionis]
MDASRAADGAVALAVPPEPEEKATGAPVRRQVPGLDGLRGLTALYVVLFHCWLYTFRGYPNSTAPAWLDVLMFGRLAVVFFLVLSGFSLAISPARHGWRSGGVAEFLRRRAWRILPPYWAALAMSLVISWALVPASHFGPPTGASILVYGLVAQDVVHAPTPNGAFWSIAVEAELYVLFPLLLLVRRRFGAVALAACATLPVIALGLTAAHANPVEGDNRLAVHLAPVFVAGVIGAGVVVASDRVRRLPWAWFALLAAAPVVLLGFRRGAVWTVQHYFWVDLAVAPAMTMLVAAVATGRPGALVRLLSTRPFRALGDFSYSLYLIHLPLVMVVIRRVAPRVVAPGMPTFCLTLALALPASVLGAWLFSRVFEMPFKRNRSWKSMIAAGRSRRGGRDARDGAPLPEGRHAEH